MAGNPTSPPIAGFELPEWARQDPREPEKAFDPQTGQNLIRDGSSQVWLDAKTGQAVGPARTVFSGRPRVLDLSKIEAGQLTLSLDDYSLSDVVHGVVTAVEPLAAEKRLGFKAEVAPGLPTDRGDGRRLSQVLLNLVGNAIKFTDKGEVAIRAGAANGAFTVAVCDTGPGIAAADQAKIFEEFQ